MEATVSNINASRAEVVSCTNINAVSPPRMFTFVAFEYGLFLLISGGPFDELHIFVMERRLLSGTGTSQDFMS